jgi:hypothetical protein
VRDNTDTTTRRHGGPKGQARSESAAASIGQRALVYAAPPFLFALFAGSPGSAAASAKRAGNRCCGLGFAMLPLPPHPWQVVLVSHGSESCNLPAKRRLLKCHFSIEDTHKICCNYFVSTLRLQQIVDALLKYHDLERVIYSSWPELHSNADSRSRTACQLGHFLAQFQNRPTPVSQGARLHPVSHNFSISSLHSNRACLQWLHLFSL